MHPTGVASAASVFAAAPSKVPFYIAGGVLVCWAVLLAVSGITHPDFPRSRRAGQFVMLTSVALVAATVTSAVVTGSGPEESHAKQRPAAAGGELALAAPPDGTPAYDKKALTAPAGTVTIRFTNPSPVQHDVTIAAGGRVLAMSRVITSSRTTVSADLKPGAYTYYCSVDAHRLAGMQGKLTVG